MMHMKKAVKIATFERIVPDMYDPPFEAKYGQILARWISII